MLLMLILMSFSFLSRASIKDLMIPLSCLGLKLVKNENEKFGISDDLSVHNFQNNETFEQFSLRMANNNKRIIRAISVTLHDGGKADFTIVPSDNLRMMCEASSEGFERIHVHNELNVFDNKTVFFDNEVALGLLIPCHSWRKVSFPWLEENCPWITRFNFKDNDHKNNISTEMSIVSCDVQDKTLFCMGKQQDNGLVSIWYADCSFLDNEDYKDFFYQPIANLKEMRIINIFGIIKNMSLFLKRALYDARGNKRLQKSLFSVFLANAHAPFAWFFSFYYGVVFVSLLNSFLNRPFHLNIMKWLLVSHFGVHILINLAFLKA